MVGAQVNVPVFEMGQGDPVEIVRAGKREAIRTLKDVMIVDTAGRLQIDETLMQELENIKQELESSGNPARRGRDDRPGGCQRRQDLRRKAGRRPALC